MTKHPTKVTPLSEAHVKVESLTEDEIANKRKEDQAAFLESTDDDHKLLQVLFRRRVISWEDVVSILDL